MRYKLLSLLTLVILLGGSVTPVQGANDIILITNNNNPVTQLEQRDIRAMFNMRLKTWSNNEAVHVFVLKQNDPVHEQFCKDILKIFPHQLQASWDRLVFSGTGEAPKVVTSEAEMISAVSTTPGAIGYLSSSTLNKQESSHEKQSLHVITIQ